MNGDVVEDVLARTFEEFGKESPISISRGTKHEYLGMTLDFSNIGTVQITMVDYIKGILADMPDDMLQGHAATPATQNLFVINTGDSLRLDKDKAEFFHRTVARLIFLSNRARPDIQTTVSFLCTRVQKPDHDDYKKLTRLMRYLQDTVEIPLTLEADNTPVIQWWVDASYGVHSDMKSHTGAMMSLGKGCIQSMSTRQKLNTRSSTEAELVGVHDAMPKLLWTKNFLASQGFDVRNNVLHQDNKSTILLAKNGRASSSKRTRHFDIRYFFVKDRIDKKELQIQYCPTEDMLADFFTKPLQGKLFYKLRNYIMNMAHSDTVDMFPGSVLELNENHEERTDVTTGITALLSHPISRSSVSSSSLAEVNLES